MKKFLKNFLIVALSVVVFAGCSDDDDDKKDNNKTTIQTGEVVDVTSTTAKVYAQVLGPYTEAGVCYSQTANPTVDGTKIQSVIAGDFSCELSELTWEKRYYVRAYVINGPVVIYGEEKHFDTAPMDVPSITSIIVNNITMSSAAARATISLLGKTQITEKGFCYGKMENPTVDGDKKVVAGTALGLMSESLTGLTPNTTYHIRGYVKYDNKVAYSSQTTFNTKGAIKITGLSAVFAYRAGVTLEIFSDGMEEAGLCWSTSPNPTVLDKVKVFANPIKKRYEEELLRVLEPETKYYVRAYVKHDGVVVYSAGEEFTTREAPIFDPYIVFSCAFPLSGANGYSCSLGMPEDELKQRTSFQDDMHKALYAGLYKAGGRKLETIRFFFMDDSNSDKIFSFGVRYANSAGSTFAAYYDYHITIAENGVFSITDRNIGNNNASTLYNHLNTVSEVDKLVAYFDYLTKAPLVLDWQVEPIIVDGEMVEKYQNYLILQSTTSEDDEYFSTHSIKMSRSPSPTPW